MNSWHVYEILKKHNGNTCLRELEERCVTISTQELSEGIHEWLLLLRRESNEVYGKHNIKKEAFPQ